MASDTPAMRPSVGRDDDHLAAPTPALAASSPAAPAAPAAYSPLTRQIRQVGLFVAGATFLAASVAVSRRSVLRRRLDSLPAFHTSNRNAPPFDGSDRFGLAVQALGLATLNVMSFGVLLTGGISWGFDLCSVAELRHRTRAALQRPANTDPEAEREMEDMMKSLLDRLGMDSTPPEKPSSLGPRPDAPADK